MGLDTTVVALPAVLAVLVVVAANAGLIVAVKAVVEVEVAVVVVVVERKVPQDDGMNVDSVLLSHSMELKTFFVIVLPYRMGIVLKKVPL